jgi:hypothetical protein
MAAERRVRQLRDLVDRIERLPDSPDRDRLLSEVRSRAVDIDTGVAPRAMLPLREPTPPPEPPRPAGRERARHIRRVVPRTPAAAVGPARTISAAFPSDAPEQWFLLDGHLSLEDASPLPDVRVRNNVSAAPWTFGLRG